MTGATATSDGMSYVSEEAPANETKVQRMAREARNAQKKVRTRVAAYTRCGCRCGHWLTWVWLTGCWCGVACRRWLMRRTGNAPPARKNAGTRCRCEACRGAGLWCAVRLVIWCGPPPGAQKIEDMKRAEERRREALKEEKETKRMAHEDERSFIFEVKQRRWNMMIRLHNAELERKKKQRAEERVARAKAREEGCVPHTTRHTRHTRLPVKSLTLPLFPCCQLRV